MVSHNLFTIVTSKITDHHHKYNNEKVCNNVRNTKMGHRDMKWVNAVGTNSADRLAWCRVVTNLQFKINKKRKIAVWFGWGYWTWGHSGRMEGWILQVFIFLFLLINFFFFFGHAMLHAGSYFPHQGLNLCPLHWELRVLTTRWPRKYIAGL